MVRRWGSVLLVGLAACAVDERASSRFEADPTISPNARIELVEELEHDLRQARHPADGGGRAWLSGPSEVPVRSPERFEITYEAGPAGIAEGGAVYFLASPFWGWSPPQVTDPDMPGFTDVTTGAEGVRLDASWIDQYLLAVAIGGRALCPGERITIGYGVGAAGAFSDAYAERRSVLWLAVDGDGDGVRAPVPSSPAVDVVAGGPAHLMLSVPSVVRPGETAILTAAVLDGWGNAGAEIGGELEIEAVPGLEMPTRVTFARRDGGCLKVPVRALREGVYRIRCHHVSGLDATSNPMLVSSTGPRIFWADLHGHSQLSDGTGTPEDYYRYARDVAALDAAALTDHDHWGMVFLDQSPELWREISARTAQFHEPGRFVTVLGFEWTSWIWGHRHVLYFDGEGSVLSSIDPRWETPQQLWTALTGKAAMTVAHHPAGGPIATSWQVSPPADIEPVVEIVSGHGSSEAQDSPAPIYAAIDGNWVRDALNSGLRFGFVGSGDSHDGHPGFAHLNGPSGGLAAIIAEELSRSSISAALLSRRCYATNGARIIVRAALAGQPIGSAVESGEHELVVMVAACAPLASVDLVRSGQVVGSEPGGGALDLTLTWSLSQLAEDEYVYVRVVQEDGGAAWISPFFVDPA